MYLYTYKLSRELTFFSILAGTFYDTMFMEKYVALWI